MDVFLGMFLNAWHMIVNSLKIKVMVRDGLELAKPIMRRRIIGKQDGGGPIRGKSA